MNLPLEAAANILQGIGKEEWTEFDQLFAAYLGRWLDHEKEHCPLLTPTVFISQYSLALQALRESAKIRIDNRLHELATEWECARLSRRTSDFAERYFGPLFQQEVERVLNQKKKSRPVRRRISRRPY